MLAGLTYVCEDDISHILEQKCIDIDYEGLNEEILTRNVCGRELIDFLNGYPIEVQDSKTITVVTGNDLPMLNAQCLLIDGYKLCWDDEPVAKPFEFIDNRCRVDKVDQMVHCLGPRFL